jgi:hypothetical protein
LVLGVSDERYFNLRSSAREVWLVVITPRFEDRAILASEWQVHSERPPPRLARSGLVRPTPAAWHGFAMAADGSMRLVAVPHLVLASTFGLLPAARLMLRRRQARRTMLIRSGKCAECGYDLRATPGPLSGVRRPAPIARSRSVLARLVPRRHR